MRVVIGAMALLLGCTHAPREPAGSSASRSALVPGASAALELPPSASAALAAEPSPALPSSGPATQAPISPPPASPPPLAPPEPGRADLDPDNDGVVAPPAAVPDCEERLRAAGIDFARASIPVTGGAKGAPTCGAEQVVLYRGSGSGIRYNAAPVLTCTMALGLARFERVLQEEAQARLGARVKRLEQAGTYSCRKMARFASMVSEHSYANAIDLRAVTLEDGRTVAVLKDFGPPATEPSAPGGQFLRRTARRAYDEAIFSVVLTPFFDPLHRDHFHLDMARYRVDGTR